MIAHALNGHPEMNESIEVYINALIGTYCSKMTEAGKTEQEVAHIVRNIARWCGWFQYLAFHILNVQDLFPVESQKSKDYIHDAVGVLGLKLMRLSYDADYVAASTPSGEVQKIFDELKEEELERAHQVLVAGKKRMQPRKSSILRAANRRLSDTEMLYLAAESVRRLSILEPLDGTKIVSIAEGNVNNELLQ